MKIHPVGAELFHADGQTDKRIDMTKLTVIFRNFSKAPENQNIRKYKQPTPSGGRSKSQRKKHGMRENKLYCQKLYTP
jgi:hypothetical protein